MRFDLKDKEASITIPEDILRADGLQIMKHFIQMDIFKFVNTLEKISFVETHVNKQTPTKKPEAKEKTAYGKQFELGDVDSRLDQGDADQEFIRFDGTTASDQSSSLTTDTSVGSLTGHIRVNINGTDFWIPYYATN